MFPSTAHSLHTQCSHLAAGSSVSNVKPFVMRYIRRGGWGGFAISETAEIRQCEELRYLSQQFQFGICSVLTVRQYKTHNIQYFAVGDGFSSYRITVLFRPNKQCRFVWKLSVCNFLVMTSHQQLMEDILFHLFFLFFSGVTSVLLHPYQVKAPLIAFLSRISFSLWEGRGCGRGIFPLGQE